MKLLNSEKDVIVEHTIDLGMRGFPPWLAVIKIWLILCLLSVTKTKLARTGLQLIKRRPELKVKLNQNHDYKRALCEDPGAIRDWFQLVENTKAKYGIKDEDTYNFDDTGFMMGIISTGAVVTGSERRERRKTVQ
jgi:hypothetical protein